jgi:hypothetical protein
VPVRRESGEPVEAVRGNERVARAGSTTSTTNLVKATRILTPYRAKFVVDSNVPHMPTVPESAWRLGRGRERERDTFSKEDGETVRDV